MSYQIASPEGPQIANKKAALNKMISKSEERIHVLKQDLC